MGQRLTAVLACVTAMMVPVQAADQKKLSDSVKSAIQFFDRHDVRSIDEFLEQLRPSPIDPIQRARVMAALPQGAIPPDAPALAKMSLGEEVLAYHGRRGLITFAIIRVAPAFIGLYGRSVILVSANILPLLNQEEFAALVAHEIGHEYVWAEYRHAEQRHDHAQIRQLELRCDGVAVLTIRRLGLNAERFIRAIETLAWYNRELGLDENAIDYVSGDDRRAFIRAIAKLQWVD
jgi:Peptidase family M48